MKSRGTTFVVMTHRTSVLAVADKMLVLRDGQTQAFGPRDEVLAALQKASEHKPQQQAQQQVPQQALGPGLRRAREPEYEIHPSFSSAANSRRCCGRSGANSSSWACSAWWPTCCMLTPTLYMLQVYDRVLVSRSELTCWPCR
jgi:ABC-type glutathione transport system ATPase component